MMLTLVDFKVVEMSWCGGLPEQQAIKVVLNDVIDDLSSRRPHPTKETRSSARLSLYQAG